MCAEGPDPAYPGPYLFSADAEAVIAAAGRTLAREYRLLRQILHGTLAGVAVLDTELRYLYVNPHMAVMTGIPAEEHLGHTLAELLPAVRRPDEALYDVLRDGQPREVVGTGSTLADSPHESRVWRVTYHRLEEDGEVLGLVGIGLEISASREHQRSLERAHERLILLDTAAVRIGTTLDVDTTCRELAEFLVPGLADAASVELLIPEEPNGHPLPPPGILRLRRAAMASVPQLTAHVAAFGTAGSYVDLQPGAAIRRSLETGHPWMDNLSSDEVMSKAAPSAERVAAYRAAGIHSSLVVPLLAPDHPLGTLTLVRAGASPVFGPEDVLVAQSLAERASLSLAKAERFTREHTMALELQRALLSEPSLPHPDLEVAARYLPSGNGALVGGDWYDSIALPGWRTLLVMGDVMGHGVEAAVAMSHYRSMIRALAVSGHPPREILRYADAMVARSGFDRVATCLLVSVDTRQGLCTYASAGHLPPVVLRPEEASVLVPVEPGPPLGSGLAEYTEIRYGLRPGCVLLLFTDGLVERRGEDIDRSLARLVGLEVAPELPLAEALDRVLAHLSAARAEDDIAVLAARVTA
ncbi:SpoIIE family protein phosphatase [Streptomyces sp. NPDC086023]|uniref:SpoIIE family protein phosphatase n=1 Tax=Streptomyces sp. NPDC086023 TaxID=3365746 RepID=UPI0037D8ADAF